MLLAVPSRIGRRFGSWVALFAWTSTVCLAAVGCQQIDLPTAPTKGIPDTDTQQGESIELTLSVAASVQDAMKAVQALYEDIAPRVTLTYNFGSSGSLAQQITQGSPTDLFLSASEQWMDNLETGGQIVSGSRRSLLKNTIVLIAPRGEADITNFQDLAADQVTRVAIAEPGSVPAGQYAKEVLTTMNLFATLQPKLVFGRDVRQVLAYVVTGNVDAGLVYGTDALTSDQVQVVARAPRDSHSAIIYPVAVVKDSTHPEAAQAFVDFLFTAPAIKVFQGYGFVIEKLGLKPRLKKAALCCNVANG